MAETVSLPGTPTSGDALGVSSGLGRLSRPRAAWRRSRQVLVAGPVVGLLLVAAALAPLLARTDPTC